MSAETELRLAVRLTNPQALASLTNIQRQLGATGTHAFDGINRSASDAAESVERVGQFGKFSFQVLQAFLLYKGFVFLKTQAEEFTRELVDMEHQVALTQTQLNNLGKNFQPVLSSDVETIAMRTGVAFSELAEMQYEILSANIEVSKSFRVMELSAKAAVGGGLKDASLAFTTALTQINAFSLGVEDLDRVLDKQFNLIKRGIFTYEQYARVAGEISIAFSGIGQDVNVANAALAAISQVFTGPQLREGATGLKNAALALAENADAFEDFGLKIHDEEGNFRNFIDIVNELKAALEGLSEQEREAVLLEMFDEKRARRGIQTLLRQTDELNQFYVEQQFALGDLDQAFATVNESLKTQADLFRNELIPAAEPFVLLLRDTLGLVRELGAAVGGTQNLAVMLMGVTGGGVLGAAARYSGVRTGAAEETFVRQGQKPMAPIMFDDMLLAGSAGPLGYRHSRYDLSPMAGEFPSRAPFPVAPATMAVGALGGVLAYEKGRSHGDVDFMEALTTVGGATLGGALFGGPAGAATFGGLATVGLVIGQAMEEEAPHIAKSFAEAFREALVEESLGVAEAFGKAVRESGEGSGFERFFQSEVLYGKPHATQRVEIEGWQRFVNKLEAVLSQRTTGGPTFEDTREVQVTGLFDLVNRGDIASVIRAGQEAESIARQTEGVFHIDPNEARTVAIRSSIEKLIPRDLTENGAEAATAIEMFATAMIENKLTVEQQTHALNLLVDSTADVRAGLKEPRDAIVEFADYVRTVNAAPAPTPDRFGIVNAQTQGLVSGDVSPLVAIFEELGESGKELADAFGRVEETLGRFERMKALLDLQFQAPVDRQVALSGPSQAVALPPQVEALLAAHSQLPSILRDLIPLPDRPVVGPGSATVTEMAERTVLDLFNENFKDAPITREELAVAFYEGLREDVAEAFGKKVPELAREDFIEFLVHGAPEEEEPEKPKEFEAPALTTLGERARAAADAMESGLIPSVYLTSGQLRGFADTMDAFNMQMQKVAVLEELKRLADIAGIDADHLDTAMVELVRGIVIAGTGFEELIGNPLALANTLSLLEQQASLTVPQQTGLAEDIAAARVAIRDGLIPSMGYTAEELDSLAAGFEQYNRQIFKVGVVQEIQRLAQVAGYGTTGLDAVIKGLIQSIALGGQSFEELLSNPQKLADLLAELKFGDVDIDQSTQNNFVIRIEAPMNAEAIAQTAENLMREINRRTQERMS